MLCVTQLFVPAETVVRDLLHKRGIQVHSSNNNVCALCASVLQQMSPLD